MCYFCDESESADIGDIHALVILSMLLERDLKFLYSGFDTLVFTICSQHKVAVEGDDMSGNGHILYIQPTGGENGKSMDQVLVWFGDVQAFLLQI